jgi:2-polyprenyl-3-methyl-5-hydroxy-6-metoxy-1,4-benzoquinol methylase
MSYYTNNLFDPKEKNNPWSQVYAHVPEGSRVLDIGCSSGNFGQVLIKDKKCEVIGLDLDKEDIGRAKKVLTQAYVRNIERDSVDDLGTFDVVMFIDVLEHLMDPVAALEKAKKLLKPKGRIVFSIPNMAHVSVRLMLLKGFFEYTPIGVLDRTHLHYYDEVEVKNLFASSQLKVAEITPVLWTYPKSKISEELYNMGLGVLEEKFYQTLEDTKAHVWQFVGYATPTKAKLSNADRSFHYRMPPEELRLTLEARDRELKDIGKQLAGLRDDNKRLTEILRNPLKHVARKVAHKVRGITKPKKK